MRNSQIEELRKRYKDNLIRYADIGLLFNCIDTLDKVLEQEKNKEFYEKILVEKDRNDFLRCYINSHCSFKVGRNKVGGINKMCEYCEKGKPILHDDSYDFLYIFIKNNQLWEKSMDMGTVINYCPMCGRKLGD